MSNDNYADAKARAFALAEWTRSHDPLGSKNAKTVLAASHAAVLVVIDGRPAFEPEAFGELVDFIDTMPF